MLETTFRSIIQFRRHIGSIRGHKQTYTDARSHTHSGWAAAVSCVRFACSRHAGDVCVMCWRARWPKQPAAFPQGWHVHYVLTMGTAGVRGPVQAKTASDSHSGTATAAPVTLGIIAKREEKEKKIFNIPLNFHGMISIGVSGAMFMKHAEGPETFNLLAFTLQLGAAKLNRRQIKCTVMWYYRIYYRGI